MAFNKINIIKSDLSARLAYISNPEKTGSGTLIAGVNCSPYVPYADMMDTKLRYDKLGGRQGYHLIQSFAPGEITPEQALEFGQAFVAKYLSDRYEALVAVHMDKEHIHAHIIWNSVSYLDGKMYHAPKGHYLEKVRYQCDEQCKAYGLSVIPPKESHSDPNYDPDPDRIARQPVAAYWDDQRGKVTRRTQLKLDIEQAIASPNILTIGQFYSEIARMGYEIKRSQYFALRLQGQERFIRTRSLGPGYEHDDIVKKILDKETIASSYHYEDVPEPVYRRTGRPGLDRKPPKKYKGYFALYWYYLYMFGAIKKKTKTIYSPYLRREIIKFDQYIAEFRLVRINKIETKEQLLLFRDEIKRKTAVLKTERFDLYRQKHTLSPEQVFMLSNRINSIKDELKQLRWNLKLIESILSKAPAMESELAKIQNPMPPEKKKAVTNRAR